MEKLMKITWVHLVIGAFAILTIAYSLNVTFGNLFAVCYATLTVSLYAMSVLKARKEREYISLTDCHIARQIVANAYQKGKIDRWSYVKGELFLTREINLKRMALGSVKRGSRIQVDELQYRASNPRDYASN